MNLRPYQTEIIKRTARELTKSGRVILQAATGAGKTVIFSEIIRRHLEKDLFNRVLVLTHRTELFQQTLQSIVRTGTTVTTLQAGQRTERTHSECRCMIAMIETMKRRTITDFGVFSLIIVDEAHRADFAPILTKMPEVKTIGATATPISASKKKPLKDLYDSIVCGPEITELIQSGYLAKPTYFVADFDESALRKQAGEFSDESQMAALSNSVSFDNLVQMWREKAGKMKTIVFNINAEHTRQTHERFASEGITSAVLLSGDPDRDEKISLFRSGEIQVLNNCEIATTGFDVPDIECVVMNRATASLPLWLQSIGRGSRTAPGKQDFTVIDLGGNITRHGLWDAKRDWKEIFYNPAKASDQPAPVKECPSCEAMVFASAPVCPYCSHQFPSEREQEIETVNGYLRQVGTSVQEIDGKRIGDLSIEELYALEISGKYKPSYIARVARTQGESFLAEYARIKGYSNGWIYYQKTMDKGFTNYRIRI
jgi:superfamily II DNA or RNA helicase